VLLHPRTVVSSKKAEKNSLIEILCTHLVVASSVPYPVPRRSSE
jgi:hypothetical protein